MIGSLFVTFFCNARWWSVLIQQLKIKTFQKVSSFKMSLLPKMNAKLTVTVYSRVNAMDNFEFIFWEKWHYERYLAKYSDLYILEGLIIFCPEIKWLNLERHFQYCPCILMNKNELNYCSQTCMYFANKKVDMKIKHKFCSFHFIWRLLELRITSFHITYFQRF